MPRAKESYGLAELFTRNSPRVHNGPYDRRYFHYRRAPNWNLHMQNVCARYGHRVHPTVTPGDALLVARAHCDGDRTKVQAFLRELCTPPFSERHKVCVGAYETMRETLRDLALANPTLAALVPPPEGTARNYAGALYGADVPGFGNPTGRRLARLRHSCRATFPECGELVTYGDLARAALGCRGHADVCMMICAVSHPDYGTERSKRVYPDSVVNTALHNVLRDIAKAVPDLTPLVAPG